MRIEIDFSRIVTYEDLQQQVFEELDIPYSEASKKYDFELAYQNRYSNKFDFKLIKKQQEYTKLATKNPAPMDTGESSGVTNANRRVPRFSAPGLRGNEEEVGRPIRPRTTFDDTYELNEKVAGRGKLHHIEEINLPPAHKNGTILTIHLNNPQMWENTINRWEADAARAWMGSDQKSDMFAYLETLLGENAMNIYNEAKIVKAQELDEIKKLGDNPYNFTRFVRTCIIGYDPSRNNTTEQDLAYRDLEQLTLESWNYIEQFSKLYLAYASKAGKYFSDQTANRYLLRLPGELAKEIHEDWDKQNFSSGIGVGPRIIFTYYKLKEKCREHIIQKQIKK